MIPAIKKYLVQQNASLQKESLSLIKLHNGVGHRNLKVSLVVLNGDKPLMFLKTVRFSSKESLIQNAHESLRSVNSLDITGVPKPLWLAKIQGVLVSAESLLQGTSIDPSNQKDITDAVNWLKIFAKTSPQVTMTVKDVAEICFRALEEMGDPSAETGELQTAMNNLFPEKTFESVYVHGDFTPGNVLRGDDGRLCVIDWDGYGKINTPLFDLLTLLERSWIGLEMKTTLTLEYMSELGIDETLLPLFKAAYAILVRWKKL